MSPSSRIGAANLTLTLALIGCGGHVNLGGRRSGGTDPLPEGGAASLAASPDTSQSQPVAKLAENFSAGTLAVAGDYLYFSGFDRKQDAGLYRCKKGNCDTTREHLPVPGTVRSLQTFGERLGVGNLEGGDYWLGSYALPDASNAQVSIRDLFPDSSTLPLFQGDFVYFSIDLEYGVYRCTLPDCNNTPKQIGRTHNLSYVNLQAEGENIFWTDGTFIYRAGAYGDDLPRTLLPDGLLSDAPNAAETNDDTSSTEASDGVVSIAAADGWLYAAVTHSETGQPCDSFCPHRMQRWPSAGGPREVLFATDGMIRRVFVFAGELAWLGRSARSPENLDGASLSTCRVEACEATTRNLGEVRSDLNAVVADDDNLYWLEAEPPIVANTYPNNAVLDRQIRRAPRLPPP